MANANNREIIYSELVKHRYFSENYELSFRPTENDIKFMKMILLNKDFKINNIVEIGCGSGGLGQYLSEQTGIKVTSTDLCQSNRGNNMTHFSNKRLNSVIPMNSVRAVNEFSNANSVLLSSYLLPYDGPEERYDAVTLKNFKGNIFINVGIYDLHPEMFRQYQGNPQLKEVLLLNTNQTGSQSLQNELLENWFILGAMPHGQKIIGGREQGFTYVVAYAKLDRCSKAGCKTRGFNFKQCSRCKTSKYCSRECQANNWKSHKSNCVKKASGKRKSHKKKYRKNSSKKRKSLKKKAKN